MSCREVANQQIHDFMREAFVRGILTSCRIAGSLRRGKESEHDVDIVCAASDMPSHTEKIERFRRNGCNIDLHVAAEDHFGPMMLTWTGPAGANIGMRVQASKKGLLLNQYGLFDRETGDRIDDNTEDDICRKVLNRPCKSPEER